MTALHPGGSQSDLHSQAMYSQVQDHIFFPIELCEVLDSALIQPVQVFLKGGFPFWSVILPIHFGVICKLCQDGLDSNIKITYVAIKQCLG